MPGSADRSTLHGPLQAGIRVSTVHPCTWYARPVVVRRCARPSTRTLRDLGLIAAATQADVAFGCGGRKSPGTTWGVGHGSGNGHQNSRTVEGWGSRCQITSRVTTDNRPAGPDASARTYRGSIVHPGSPLDRSDRGAIGFLGGVRRLAGSGRAAGLAWQAGPTIDAPSVELGLHDPSAGHQIAVAGDRAGQPIDVGRLELGHLAEGVTAELSEVELVAPSRLQAGRLRRPEPMDAAALEGTGGIGRPERLTLERAVWSRCLTRWRRVPGRRRVSRPKGLARVDAPSDRSGRAGPWRPTPAARRLGRAPPVRPRRRFARTERLTTKGLVCVVDLGHASRRLARSRGVVAGQVRMVLTGQPPPGRLDRLRAGPGFDAEDFVRITSWHELSVPTVSCYSRVTSGIR
jgi:hypothetical protein